MNVLTTLLILIPNIIAMKNRYSVSDDANTYVVPTNKRQVPKYK